jgi:hypothetical protein
VTDRPALEVMPTSLSTRLPADPDPPEPGPAQPIILRKVGLHRGYWWFMRNGLYTYEAVSDESVFDWEIESLNALDIAGRSFAVRGMVGKEYEVDASVLRALAKARRIELQLVELGRAAEASALREASLKLVRPAVSQRLTERFQARRIFRVVMAGVLVLALVAPAPIVGYWVQSRRGLGLVVVVLMQSIVLYLLLVAWVLIYARDDDGSRARGRVLRVIPFGVLCFFVYAAWSVFSSDRTERPHFVVEFLAGLGVAIGLLVAAFAVLVVALPILEFAEARVSWGTSDGGLVLDLILLVTAAMEWQCGKWERDDVVRKLDEAARRAVLTFPKSVPRGSPLRPWAHRRARQIAAVLRRHAEWAMELPAIGRGRMADSLLNGLVYVVKGDWDSFLVVEPAGFAKSLVRRYAPRVALSLLLVALAFLLPFAMPHVIKDPVSFQATVLVAAGFALLAPDVQKAADAVKSFGVGSDRAR